MSPPQLQPQESDKTCISQESQKEEFLDTVQPESNVIEVPDGGYGWFVVIAIFLFNISTWASNSGFSIYLAYYLQHDKFAGGTKLDYAAIGGIAFGAGLLFMPLIYDSKI